MTWTLKSRGDSTAPIVSEFECLEHGRFEETVERKADVAPCPDCGHPSPWVISAPKAKVWSVPCSAVSRGGDNERRPGMLDTRPLADGMSMRDWRKIQDGHRQERRHQQLIKRGLKQKRIQVG